MPKIVVASLAQTDIDEIWDHIARDSAVNRDRRESSSGSVCSRRIPAWALPATIFGQGCAGFAMSATDLLSAHSGRYRSRSCGARRAATEDALEALVH
jgi:hypothetical protein